jgi:hypothetical protein
MASSDLGEDYCKHSNKALSSTKDVEFMTRELDFLLLKKYFSGEFVSYIPVNTCSLQTIIPPLFYT